MTGKLDALYEAAPVPLQNLMAAAFGLRERLRRHSGHFDTYLAELENQQWWSNDELMALQAARLRSTIAHASGSVPHYRDMFARLGLSAADISTVDELHVLPPLEKEALRQAPESFTPDIAPGRLIEQTTGGTTGTPLRYFATSDAVQFNYATYHSRMWGWAGVQFGDRLATLNGKPIVPMRSQGAPFWRSNPAFNQLYFSVYHLSDQNLPAYLDRLARFDPVVIVGYTSAIHRIARFVIDQNQEGRINPRAVLVSSETLHPWMRADLEAAFGCRVTNGYSLGELVAWANDCEHGGMHISPEYGVIELVACADGLEIVATGLINPAMPLLRYRTGDMVIDEPVPEQCPCGRALPLLPTILGRVDDVVRTPEGATVGPASLSLAFQGVPHLKAAQIHQSDESAIDILVEPAAGYTASDEEVLLTELRRRVGTGLRIDLEHVDHIPRTSGGKQRLVVSTIGQ